MLILFIHQISNAPPHSGGEQGVEHFGLRGGVGGSISQIFEISDFQCSTPQWGGVWGGVFRAEGGSGGSARWRVRVRREGSGGGGEGGFFIDEERTGYEFGG